MTALKTPTFLGRAAITGVGFTAFTRESNRSVLSQALEACRMAIQDARLSPDDIDGLASFSWAGDSVPTQSVATGLGLGDVTYVLDLSMGGQAPSFLVANAAMAVTTGMASHVVIYRAMNGRSGFRVGRGKTPDLTGDYRAAVGLTSYPQLIALWARRYMIETSATYDDLASVPISQRKFAFSNERAQRRDPLNLDQYREAPMIVDPFRSVDCTIEVDGACAIVVSSLRAARSLHKNPIVIQSAAYQMGPHSGFDTGDALLWDDLSRNYTGLLADRLWGYAGISPDDVDCAQLYDCFSSSVLFAVEGLRLAPRGAAADLIRTGRLPINTNGGLLCEGYLHGMNTVAEAVLQLQGRSSGENVEGAETCVVTSGAMMDGSALVLARV